MNESPLVSVIIPAYNASEWISETLDSILSQSFKDYEIIVVNDGSTDNTVEVVECFMNRVKCISKLNGGQASARNIGIKEGKGKYVAFIDSDDLWAPDKLYLEVGLLEKSKLKWVYSDAIAFDSKKRTNLYKYSEVQRHYEGDILEPLFKSCFIPSPTPIVEKSVFANIGLFNENSNMRNREDWDMWLRIAAVYPIAYVPKPLAYYRVHSASATGGEDRISALKGYVATVEAAVQREPRRLGQIKNVVISRIYFIESRNQAYLGHSTIARRFLKESLKLTPWWGLLYIYYLLIPVFPWFKIIGTKPGMTSIKNFLHRSLGK